MQKYFDLTKVSSNCISAVLHENLGFYNCKSKNEVFDFVSKVLEEHNINTEASRRLLLHIKLAKNCSAAIYTVQNSMLAGMGLNV